MESKYSLLIKNSTWKVVSRPTQANVITGRWIFKQKKDQLGNILKYKSC